jgi:hypothetical protein
MAKLRGLPVIFPARTALLALPACASVSSGRLPTELSFVIQLTKTSLLRRPLMKTAEENVMKCFLNLIFDDERVNDPEGEDFADVADARLEAILSARCIAGDRLRYGEPIKLGSFEITDSEGRILDTVTFEEALGDAGSEGARCTLQGSRGDPARSPGC